jgi:hypothetical protein
MPQDYSGDYKHTVTRLGIETKLVLAEKFRIGSAYSPMLE